MKWRVLIVLLVLALVVSLSVSAAFSTNQPLTHQTGSAPEGDEDKDPEPGDPYADEVRLFQEGNPPPDKDHKNPQRALEEPDDRYVSLGCGGSLITRFVDNVLIDEPGTDLIIYEVGPEDEEVLVEISKNGKEWIKIGKVSGRNNKLDISKFVKPGEVFHYVRLTDLKSDCSGLQPGADIDAIEATSSGIKINIQAAVLFAFDKYDIRPEAAKILHDVALQILQYPGSKIIIEGHTCSMGTDQYNQKLSENRARSVRNYLVNVEKMTEFQIEVRGLGETAPIAPNDTEVNREKNRRVEIIVILPESSG